MSNPANVREVELTTAHLLSLNKKSKHKEGYFTSYYTKNKRLVEENVKLKEQIKVLEKDLEIQKLKEEQNASFDGLKVGINKLTDEVLEIKTLIEI